MKRFTFFVFLFFFAASVFAQSEVAPNNGLQATKSLKSANVVWTVQFNSNVASELWAPGTYGIESDGSHLFVTKWASNKFYKLTTAGVLVDSFSVTGTMSGGIRDLAYDGTYFYGSNNSNTIYKMDFVAKTIVSTIVLPTGFAVRHISYDPTANSNAGGLWCGPWNTQGPRLYSMTGTYLDSIPAANLGVYTASGSAFDNVTPGGPYLWFYSQATGSNMNDIFQVKISTKQKTGISNDMTQIITGLAAANISGGLFQKTNLITGTTTLGGMAQGSRIWGVDLASTTPPANGMNINTLNLLTAIQINTPQTFAGMLTNSGSNAVTAMDLNYSVNGGANVTQALTGLNIAGLSTYNYSHTTTWTPATAGTYTIKLWASNINGNATLSSDTITKTVNAMTTLVFKKVVLEEYTGIHCTYCPDGHKIANTYKALHPNDVFLINIHQGSFATPSAGEPDFRTAFGDALANQTALTGYPSGTINRHIFAPATSTALSRSVWAAKGDEMLATPTYATMNIDSAVVDVQTRILSVYVKANYIGSASAVNLMNVALLQNNIEGPQTGGSTNPAQMLPNGKYNHNHALRHLLTGQWGDTIAVTSAGTTFTKVYNYTLPNSIVNIDLDLGNLEVIGFIAEGKQEIITGAEKSITLNNILYSKDVSIESITTADEICAPELKPVLRVKNLGADVVTSISFTYSVNGGTAATYNWNGSINPYASALIEMTTITGFTVLASNSITVGVVNVNGVADQNAANNSKTKSNILQTNNTTSGTTGHVFTFTQDRYGSESSWKIIDDATGATIASGGPYTDLAATGTLAHTANVTFSATGCYTVIAMDSYGDGINAGYGAGSYKLVNGANQTVISSTGQFQTEERKIFNLTSLIGIEETGALSVFSVSPNPAKDNVQLSFNLNDSKEVNVSIYNNLGAIVYSNNEGTLTSGNHTINVKVNGLSSGIYYMSVKAGDNTIAKKLVIE
jgi:hypothetical protein